MGRSAAELDVQLPTKRAARADGAVGLRPLSVVSSQPAHRIVSRQTKLVIRPVEAVRDGAGLVVERQVTREDASSGPAPSKCADVVSP